MDELDLSDFFTTRSQATDFSARLSTVAENLYEVDLNLEKTLQEQFGVKKKDKFLTLLRENKIPLDSNTALKDFISRIQDTVSSMPTAAIILAIEPNEQILKVMSDWFLLNLEQQILIDVQIDPDLIAGAIVNYKGKHHDASIRSIFNQICANTLNNTNKTRSTERHQIDKSNPTNESN